MQLLNSQVMKLGLLVVVVAALLVGLNMNQKKLGKEVALLGTLAVFVVGSYMGYTLLNEKPEPEVNVEPEMNEEVMMNNLNANLNANVVEGFQDGTENEQEPEQEPVQEPAQEPEEEPESPTGNGNDSEFQSVDGEEKVNRGCLPKDVLNPDELLPLGLAPNNWDTPANPGGIDGPNFLNPEHLVGINTVGQSLRNANRQLRSEPPNPQVKVSPWLQTTIEPDTNRRPLEIGENCA